MYGFSFFEHFCVHRCGIISRFNVSTVFLVALQSLAHFNSGSAHTNVCCCKCHCPADNLNCNREISCLFASKFVCIYVCMCTPSYFGEFLYVHLRQSPSMRFHCVFSSVCKFQQFANSISYFYFESLFCFKDGML